AQPLAGYNTFEQGAGELNIEGAIRVAKLVRSDPSLFRANGTPMLNGAPPVPQTTIAAQPFDWAQGFLLNHTYATGTDLITTYQGVYDTGHVLSDGLNESEAGLSV